jgi:flagellar biosynthetic protein FliR
VNVDLNQTTLVALVLCSIRVLAWLMVAPPFATSGLPRVVKTAVAVALALAVTPIASAHAPAAEVAPLIGSTMEQVVVGAGLGFATRIIFSAVEAAGGLIDLFGGFSLSFALDPLSQNNNSVFGRFYSLMCTTLLFASTAHLVIIAGFLRSFQTIPLDSGISLQKLSSSLVPATSNMFLASLQIAGPLIVVLFIADISMGLLNRIAPQLNVFSLSFPLKIVLTLGLVGLGFALLPETITQLANQAAAVVTQVTS